MNTPKSQVPVEMLHFEKFEKLNPEEKYSVYEKEQIMQRLNSHEEKLGVLRHRCYQHTTGKPKDHTAMEQAKTELQFGVLVRYTLNACS